MSRFFKKSDNIDTLTTKEIDEFLNEENLNGKVTPAVVKDFYNCLSSVLAKEDIKLEEDIDFSQFGCKNEGDNSRVLGEREREMDFAKQVNPEILTGSRLLKAAAALTYQYEKGGEIGENEDINSYLRYFFTHMDNDSGEGEKTSFSDMLEMDVYFLKYMALLSNKKAFAKSGTKLIKDVGGKLLNTLRWRISQRSLVWI